MSLEEASICSSPSQSLSVDISAASSTRSTEFVSGSNVNGSSDRLVEDTSTTASSSQISLLQLHFQADSDVQPIVDGVPGPGGSGTSTPDVDPQIMEALRSKDRLFVLKIGEQMEGLIRERHARTRIMLSPENAYQRLLVHRCAAYYKLSPEPDPSTRGLTVGISIESKIPLRRISELLPSELIAAPPPAFKIMRRSDNDRRRQKSSLSRAGSIAGEEGDFSDREPSENGSMGGRSTASKKRSLAEREAAYQEARARIFMDLEEKVKANERDTSASSSTLSLASASGSGSQSGGAGGSTADEIDDDNVSTVPTESEWSIPATGDSRVGTESGASSSSSSRSYRAGLTPYGSHGDSSGRASRSASPAITFPNIYDQQPPVAPYPPNAYATPPGPYGPYPMYAYPPPSIPGQASAPSQPYFAPYPYFSPYPYGPPPQHHAPPHANSDPASPMTGPADGYPHHAHAPGMQYFGPHPYGWTPPTATPQLQPNALENHSPPFQNPSSHGSTPPMQYPPQQFQPYMSPPPSHTPYGGYAVPPQYYPPPVQGPPVNTHPHSQPIYPIELPPTNGGASDQAASNGMSSGVSSGHGSPSPTFSRHSSSSGGNGNHHYQNHSGGGRRGTPPHRGAWSYGPGVGMHHNAPGSGIHYGHNGPGEIVGPRLSSSMRRTSGASSGSNGNRTPGDETASTASSSTSSSSSRRTYMSGMSTPSKHPLPPRPDWAAGLKPQPTLHGTRNKHDSNNNSRNMSPARPPSGHHSQNQSQQHAPQQLSPIFLQPTDFPPLSSISSGEKRPVAGGAWTNPNQTARSILSPNSGIANSAQGPSYRAALFSQNPTNGNTNVSPSGATVNRLEEDERGFERPRPKTNSELFNPKGGPKRGSPQHAQTQAPLQTQDRIESDKIEIDRVRGEAIATAILVDKLSSLNLQDQGCKDESAAAVQADSIQAGSRGTPPPSAAKGVSGLPGGSAADPNGCGSADNPSPAPS